MGVSRRGTAAAIKREHKDKAAGWATALARTQAEHAASPRRRATLGRFNATGKAKAVLVEGTGGYGVGWDKGFGQWAALNRSSGDARHVGAWRRAAREPF